MARAVSTSYPVGSDHATAGAPVHESVLDAIGQTPLIRLNRVSAGIAAPVYVKAEFLNPGASVKDRAARHMVLAAERDGSLRPGGVIVEGTSGNTGVGLAIVAAQRGYRCIVVTSDKTSAEKLAALRAYGAELVLTLPGVPRQDPRHVSQLAQKIAEETDGGWFANQYDNLANPQAHRDTTGPEIWQQTGGRITHFVAGAGTGGTITGTGEYLKEVSGGRVQVIAADPASSRYGGGDGSPYYIEAVGHYLHPETVEDVWPQSYHPEVVDSFERITDRESIAVAGRLGREEGLLVGGSSGTAIAAALRVAAGLTADDLVVVLAPDSGRGYLSKYFDETWLLRNGFRDADPAVLSVADVAAGAPPALVVIGSGTMADARTSFQRSGGSGAEEVALVALPRTTTEPARAFGDIVGALRRSALDGRPDDQIVSTLAGPPLPAVGAGETVTDALERVPPSQAWVPVLVDGRVTAVLSRARLARAASQPGATDTAPSAERP
jgi:cystathionine beta-synthase